MRSFVTLRARNKAASYITYGCDSASLTHFVQVNETRMQSFHCVRLSAEREGTAELTLVNERAM